MPWIITRDADPRRSTVASLQNQNDCPLLVLDAATVSEQAENSHKGTPAEDALLGNFLDATSQFSDSVSEIVSLHAPCTSPRDWLLESSQSSYSEQYIIEDTLHNRSVYFSMTSVYQSTAYRIDKYFLLFANDARHWNRVTVTAKIPAGLLVSESSSMIEIAYQTPPGDVQLQLGKLLRRSELYDTVTNVSVELVACRESGIISFDMDHSHICEDLHVVSIDKTPAVMDQFFSRVTPVFKQSYIGQRSRLTEHFFVSLGSQNCLEQKLPFSTNKESAKSFMGRLKGLQLAQGCRGVAEFIGVVSTDDKTELRGYLVRAPENGPLRRVFEDATLKGTPITWDRRERWIRQMIIAVKDIHLRDIVIGEMTTSNVWVDSNDDLVVLDLNSKLSYTNMPFSFPNCVAQEFRMGEEIGDLAFGTSLTSQSDLFQLGLFIWLVAQHISFGPGTFSRQSECQNMPYYRCAAAHTRPVDLPPCKGEEVPDYINAIVSRCRQERPSARESAAELPELLPSITVHDSLAPPTSRTVSDTYGWPFGSDRCDGCGHVAADELFHCNACSLGDFDLCPACVARGFHCYKQELSLVHRVRLKCGGFKIIPTGI